MIAIADFSAIVRAWEMAIFRASWQGGLALCLAWGICNAWRQLPARVKCWVWRLAYAKLLIAFFWVAPIVLPILRPNSLEPQLVVKFDHASSVAKPGSANDRLPSSDRLPQVPARTEIGLPESQRVGTQFSSSVPRSLSMSHALFLLWLTGVAAFSFRILLHWRSASRLLRHSNRLKDRQTLEICQTISRQFGRRRPPALLWSADVTGPLLLGVFRPNIVVPSGFEGHPRPSQQLMLAHELAHLARRDLWWNWLAIAAEACFFFHPLIWLARRDWRLNQEIACDDSALQATGVPQVVYGQALLEVACGIRPRQLLMSAAIVESRKTLERRLLAMKHPQFLSRRHTIAFATCIAFLSVAIIPSWRLIAQAAPRDRAADTTQADDKPQPSTTNAAKTGAAVEDAHPTTRKTSGLVTGEVLPILQTVGTVTADTFHLDSPVDGIIQKVDVSSGDRVKKGQLLVEFDSRHAQVALATAKAKVKLEQLTLEKQKEMNAKRVTSELEVQQAEVSLLLAQTELEARELDLSDRRMTAPADGVVQFLYASAGEFVTKGKQIAVIIQTANLSVDFQSAEDQVSMLRQGQAVEFSCNGAKYLGHVASLSPALDITNGSIRGRAQLDNAAGKLLPGMFGKLTIRLDPNPNEQWPWISN